MDKERLAVGDSTILEIIFSTKRYSSRITKRPRIRTNEGPPDKNVQIIATVVRRPDSTYPVVVKPYKLDLSQIGEKVRDEIKFTIQNVSEQDLDLNVVAGRPEFFTIEFPESVAAGKTAEGILTLTPDAIEQEFEKSFTFQVSDETGTRFTVPVKRKIRKPAAETPTAAKGYGGKGH